MCVKNAFESGRMDGRQFVHEGSQPVRLLACFRPFQAGSLFLAKLAILTERPTATTTMEEEDKSLVLYNLFSSFE